MTKIYDNLYIVGLFGQDFLGRDKQYTDYEAFKIGLSFLDAMHNRQPDLQMYMPYKIGCNLGGGNWNIVQSMIPEYITLVQKDK